VRIALLYLACCSFARPSHPLTLKQSHMFSKPALNVRWPISYARICCLRMPLMVSCHPRTGSHVVPSTVSGRAALITHCDQGYGAVQVVVPMLL